MQRTHRRGIAETYAYVGYCLTCRPPFLMGANDDRRRAARITFNIRLIRAPATGRALVYS